MVADRAVEMEDLQGNKIRGTGLNVMKLVEDTVYSFDQMIDNLKNFLKVISMDKEAKSDLEKIIQDFSMKLTLYKKYEKVLSSLKFKNQAFTKEKYQYGKLFKEYGWVTYITSEKKIVGDSPEIPRRMYLMASVFQFLLINSSSDYRSAVINLDECKFHPVGE